MGERVPLWGPLEGALPLPRPGVPGFLGGSSRERSAGFSSSVLDALALKKIVAAHQPGGLVNHGHHVVGDVIHREHHVVNRQKFPREFPISRKRNFHRRAKRDPGLCLLTRGRLPRVWQ